MHVSLYAESLYCTRYLLFRLKNQSFWHKSGKPQPIRTKFGTRAYIYRSRNDNVRGILGAIGPFWAKWGKTSPAEPEFLCVVIQTTFGNFTTADFHQIWPRNVVLCPVVESGKTVSKTFTLGVICSQNLKSQTGTSLRAGYKSRDAQQRDTVYSTY